MSEFDCRLFNKDPAQSDLIQISIQNVAIIWDLHKDEEVDSLVAPQSFNGCNEFALTGFQVRASPFSKMVKCNRDRTLFLADIPSEVNNKFFRLYSTADVQFMLRLFQISLKSDQPAEHICEQVMTSNVRGQTFVSLFRKNHKLVTVAANQLALQNWPAQENSLDNQFVR